MQTRAGSGGTATLAERLAARRMPLGAAMAMLDALTEIVGECHRQGRADGALTPARALLDGASVRLDPAVGAADPAYLSPQQLEGKAADSRADVFALGVIAYRAITGADPFGEPGGRRGRPARGHREGRRRSRAIRAEARRARAQDPARRTGPKPDRAVRRRADDARRPPWRVAGGARFADAEVGRAWGVPEGEVTEGMAEFLADSTQAAEGGALGES